MPSTVPPPELALPFDLVGHRHVEPLVGERLVLTLRRRQQLREQSLRPVLALHGVHRERPQHRLRHRHGDVPLAVANRDRAVGLVEDDLLQPLLVQRRTPGLRSLRPALRDCRTGPSGTGVASGGLP